jgi:hypothetical protein
VFWSPPCRMCDSGEFSIPPYYVLHVPSIVSAMAKKLLHSHSIYSRFPLYLLFRRCDGEVIMYHHSIYSIYISAVDTLSKVQGRSNYVLHSIYSIFLIYLLYRRCYGELITYHHSIYSIYLRRRYSVESARAELLRTSIVYTPYF